MGKLVTFWSPYVGQSKATSTLCAMAGAIGIQYPELEIAISHTKAESIELEERLDFRGGYEEKRELYEKSGMAALALNYMQAVLTPEKIRRCAIPLFMKNLSLFPGMGKKGVQEEMQFRILTEHLVKEFSAVFLDLESGKKRNSFRFMSVADLVIIVLPQNPSCWERFFREDSECLVGKRIGIIIGEYLDASRYNIPYFLKKREYKLKSGFIGGVPVNSGYRDAMIEGRTLEFFFRNQRAEKKEENYEFIIQTKKAADCIKKELFIS